MREKLKISFMLCSLVSCGYHIEQDKELTISIPYVQGDHNGALTDELVRQIAMLGKYQVSGEDSLYRLEVKIINDHQDVIGYEYDHQNVVLFNRLVSNEERRLVEVELSLIEQANGKILVDKEKVSAGVEYDFVDPESIPDVVVTPSTEPSLAFSLGQLDSVEGARAGALSSLYRKLAQKIASGL